MYVIFKHLNHWWPWALTAGLTLGKRIGVVAASPPAWERETIHRVWFVSYINGSLQRVKTREWDLKTSEDSTVIFYWSVIQSIDSLTTKMLCRCNRSSPTHIDCIWGGTRTARCTTAWSEPNWRDVWHFPIARSLHVPPLLCRRGCTSVTSIFCSADSLLHQYGSGSAIPNRVNYFGNTLKTCSSFCHTPLHHRRPITRQHSWGFVWHRPGE